MNGKDIEILNFRNGQDFPNLLEGNAKQLKADKNQAFYAETDQDQRELEEIRDQRFSGITTKLIQDCYDILKDTSLVFNILTVIFAKNLKKDYSFLQPGLGKSRSHVEYEAVFQKLKKKKSEKKKMIQLGGSGVPKQEPKRGNIVSGGVANGDYLFWTPELLKKLNFFNYQRGNSNQAQNIYEESRRETQAYYSMRKQALERLKKAMKAGN